MSEFSIIEKYFSVLGRARKDVLLGVGDDAAIVDTSSLHALAISVDTLIENVHFPASTSPYDIGWKSLAVNLSDMAAMAATPRWATLALTLPNTDKTWLTAFSTGFSDLAKLHNVQLIGGDTTRGNLSISVQIIGNVNEMNALRRDRAKVGDGIYVTGCLGDAALGLKSLSESLSFSLTEKDTLLTALNRPNPRVKEALQLQPYVNAAIDVSDGLAADLSHILQKSQVCGVVDVDAIPVSELYGRYSQKNHFHDLALCGGDDYELCFTVAKRHEKKVQLEAKKMGLLCTRIGDIVEGSGLRLKQKNETYKLQQSSYDHFKE